MTRALIAATILTVAAMLVVSASLQITHEEAVARATGTNPATVRQP